MIETLKGILDGLLTVFDLIFTLIKTFVMFLLKIPIFITFITTSTVTLPPVIVTFMIMGVMISIILFILGRV